MLGEPALVAAHHRRDAQREALLAEQRVAAVAGAVATRSRASRGSGRCTCGPCCTATGTSFCPAASGAPTECTQGTNAPSSPSTSQRRAPHARHDPHVGDDVGAVGDLDADVRDVAADRAHRERHDVHRAPAHAAVEQSAQRLPHLRRARPSCWSARRRPRLLAADEGAVLDAGDVGRIGPARDSCSGAWRDSTACSVPAATISSHSRSYSSSLPSHQTTRSGLVSAAMSRTHISSRVWRTSMPVQRCRRRWRRSVQEWTWQDL